MEIAEKNVESHSNNSNGNDFGQITEAISNLHLGHEDDADLATGRIIENDTKVQVSWLLYYMIQRRVVENSFPIFLISF